MTAPAPRSCARGERCYAAIREGDQVIAAPCTRPLCEVCETAVRRVLEQAPDLYVRLRLKTLDRDVTARGPQVTLSKGSPLPLHAQALHLGEELVWLLTTWEDEVRHIAGLTVVDRTQTREGPQVQAAASLLAAHLTAWISAPTTAFGVSMTAPEIEQSGADAAGVLLDWRATVRRLPGFDVTAGRAVHRYPQPCPTCGVAAITHTAGDDLAQCQSCGATAPYGVLGAEAA